MKRIFSILITLFLLICFASGCQSLHMASSGKKQSAPNYVIPDYLEPMRATVLQEALRYIGTPYCYGGKTPFCTDCSGFVMQAYRTVGITTPRTAHDQFLKYASEDVIPEPGDLIFFRYADKGKIAHVGIYVGDDSIIHASEKKGVILTTLEYMRSFIVGYGRMPIHEFSAK